MEFELLVSGFRSQAPVFGFRVSGFGFRISGFGFGFRVSGFGRAPPWRARVRRSLPRRTTPRASASAWFRVSGLDFWAPYFGVRASGFRSRISVCECLNPGFGAFCLWFRDSFCGLLVGFVCRVSGCGWRGLRVRDAGFLGSGFECHDTGFKYRCSGIGSQLWVFSFWVSSSGSRVSSLNFRVSILRLPRFRVPGFTFRVCGLNFGSQLSGNVGFECRVSGPSFRDSGFAFRVAKFSGSRVSG